MSAEINDTFIEQLVATYEATEEAIVEDADEDPLLILDIQENLENLIVLTSQLMEGWDAFFDEMDEHETARYFIRLSPALKSSQEVLTLIKKYGLNKGDVKTFYRRLKPEIKDFASAMKKLLNNTINPDDIEEDDDEE